MWTKEEIHSIVLNQRKYFKTNATLDTDFRIYQLRKLKTALSVWEDKLLAALKEDLGRSREEAYFCDIGSCVLEINEYIKGLKKWNKTEKHFSGITCFPSILTEVHRMPYGVTYIISPFNFPVLLTVGVLAASIAGGNTAVIKASSKSSRCTEVLKEMIKEIYPEEYVTLIDGGHDVGDLCLEERFDKIFYTGSPAVAKHVMAEAAKNLTPVALELGGETGNWAIVRKDADLKDAARKIAFFKICNSGQICINVNQVAVAEEVLEDFLKELKAAFRKQIGDKPLENEEYPKLIWEKAYLDCEKEADTYRDRIVFGGKGNREALKFEPTIICPVDIEEEIINHELFCPLLPVVPFKDEKIDEILETISDREHGLALYIFTKDIKWAKKVMKTQQFGGGCINEVCLHMMVKGVPFNGTGHSGMGAYHGKYGFEEFTHPCTVLYGSTHFNLSLREHPYSGKRNGYKLKMLKLFER